MTKIGVVDSLWRYPVKSMRGEEAPKVFVGFSGIYGDRLYAFKSSASEKCFPYLTGRELEGMLLYRPKFRNSAVADLPEYLTEAENSAPGLNPCFDDPANLSVDVETPSGQVFAIDDHDLCNQIRQGLEDGIDVTLLRSDRSLTDCRPISLISTQTIGQLGKEVGEPVDPRRFRANLYLDLKAAEGFAEDAYVGKTLAIGPKVKISILERDPRCKMITLDPETGKINPRVLQHVGRDHGGHAGIYGAVLVEGLVSQGDTVELVV